MVRVFAGTAVSLKTKKGNFTAFQVMFARIGPKKGCKVR